MKQRANAISIYRYWKNLFLNLILHFFLSAVGIEGTYEILQAIHSKTDAKLGESDIVFILDVAGKRSALHIENKIDAIAQENQSGRYYERIHKDIAAGEYDEGSVLIVAPEKYLESNKEAQKYGGSVTYEQIRDYFAQRQDVRSSYKLALIERAITDQKNGYQYEADTRMVEFCEKMNAYHKIKYPGLPAGSIAWWRFYPTILNDTTIVFKAIYELFLLSKTIAAKMNTKNLRKLEENKYETRL